MDKYNDTIITKPQGHLRIYEKETGKILLDNHNDINPENFSYAIAASLCGMQEGNIRYMVFGNGGARVTSSNKYIYSVPHTVGKAASLYNQTYEKDLVANKDADNYMKISHASGQEYTDIIVHATLEKAGLDDVLGNTGDNNSIVSEKTFSEIGLLTEARTLITHICFFPIMKSSQASIVIDYLLRIKVV